MTTRPQPVVNAATAAAAVTALSGTVLAVLVMSGVIGTDDANRLSEALTPALTALIGVVSTIVAAFRARAKVTPLASPVSADGVPLVTDLPGDHSSEAFARSVLEEEARRSDPA